MKSGIRTGLMVSFAIASDLCFPASPLVPSTAFRTALSCPVGANSTCTFVQTSPQATSEAAFSVMVDVVRGFDVSTQKITWENNVVKDFFPWQTDGMALFNPLSAPTLAIPTMRANASVPPLILTLWYPSSYMGDAWELILSAVEQTTGKTLYSASMRSGACGKGFGCQFWGPATDSVKGLFYLQVAGQLYAFTVTQQAPDVKTPVWKTTISTGDTASTLWMNSGQFVLSDPLISDSSSSFAFATGQRFIFYTVNAFPTGAIFSVLHAATGDNLWNSTSASDIVQNNTLCKNRKDVRCVFSNPSASMSAKIVCAVAAAVFNGTYTDEDVIIGLPALACYDLLSGKFLWRQPFSKIDHDNFGLLKDTVPIFPSSNDIVILGYTAYSLKDGSIIWRLSNAKFFSPDWTGNYPCFNWVTDCSPSATNGNATALLFVSKQGINSATQENYAWTRALVIDISTGVCQSSTWIGHDNTDACAGAAYLGQGVFMQLQEWPSSSIEAGYQYLAYTPFTDFQSGCPDTPTPSVF